MMRRLLIGLIVIAAFSIPAYAQDKPAGSAERGFET
jgi:hypothetical protein